MSTGVRTYTKRVDVIYDEGHCVTHRTLGVALGLCYS
jgi:hypothetical protein